MKISGVEITVSTFVKAYKDCGLKPIAGDWFQIVDTKHGFGCCPISALIVKKNGAEMLERLQRKPHHMAECAASTLLGISPKAIHAFIRGFDGSDPHLVVRKGAFNLGRECRAKFINTKVIIDG